MEEAVSLIRGFIIARHRSVGKVIFSVMSVRSRGGGVVTITHDALGITSSHQMSAPMGSPYNHYPLCTGPHDTRTPWHTRPPLYRDPHLLVTSGSQDRFKVAHLGTPAADIWQLVTEAHTVGLFRLFLYFGTHQRV